MQTRTLLLAGVLAAAGCTEHRVATAPPASAPASAVATAPAATTTATATTSAAPAQPHPLPQTQQATRFYTPSDEQQSQIPVSVQGGQPVQAAQPVHALGQPGGQANLPSQNAYNTPPQGYTASGLNSDPNNPSGAPGYSPWGGF